MILSSFTSKKKSASIFFIFQLFFRFIFSFLKGFFFLKLGYKSEIGIEKINIKKLKYIFRFKSKIDYLKLATNFQKSKKTSKTSKTQNFN